MSNIVEVANTNEPAQAVEPSQAEVAKGLALPETATLADIIALVNQLAAAQKPKRDRGPESTRDMTEDDARRIMLGDLRDVAHKKAAEILGLSYGQVYSARFGHTFKTVYAEARKNRSYPWVTKGSK